MTEHQRARRARKSKAFFAKLAERAALAGNPKEAARLLKASQFQRAVQIVAEAITYATSLRFAA